MRLLAEDEIESFRQWQRNEDTPFVCKKPTRMQRLEAQVKRLKNSKSEMPQKIKLLEEKLKKAEFKTRLYDMWNESLERQAQQRRQQKRQRKRQRVQRGEAKKHKAA